MRSAIVAKAVILSSDRRVLLLRRSSADAGRPGQWDFPGGGIEPGEACEAGLAREVREETGLSFSLAEFTLAYAATEWRRAARESVTRLLFVAHCAVDAQVQLSFEHDNFRWVSVATALADFPHRFYATGLRYADEHGLLIA